MVADVNVIDLPRLQLHRPVKVADLPGGASPPAPAGRRLRRHRQVRRGHLRRRRSHRSSPRPPAAGCPLTAPARRRSRPVRPARRQRRRGRLRRPDAACLARAARRRRAASASWSLAPSAASELPLADIVDVYEEVSRADGSTGWCYFAADCTAAYFGAYLPDGGAEEVFAGGVPLMAGQFAPNGTAVVDRRRARHRRRLPVRQRHRPCVVGRRRRPDRRGRRRQPRVPLRLLPGRARPSCSATGTCSACRPRPATTTGSATSTSRRTRAFDFFAPVVHRGGPMHALGVLPLTAAGHAGWALGVTRRVPRRGGRRRRQHHPPRGDLVAGDQRALPLRARHPRGALPGRSGLGPGGLRPRPRPKPPATASCRRSPPTSCARPAGTSTSSGADIARQAYLLTGTRALRDGPIQRCFRDLHAGSQHFFASPSAAIDLATALLADG